MSGQGKGANIDTAADEVFSIVAEFVNLTSKSLLPPETFVPTHVSPLHPEVIVPASTINLLSGMILILPPVGIFSVHQTVNDAPSCTTISLSKVILVSNTWSSSIT